MKFCIHIAGPTGALTALLRGVERGGERGFFDRKKLYENLKHVPEGLDVKPPTAIAAHVWAEP